MDAKIEFRNRSGVIARTIREDDAAVEAEAGSNDVLPGGKRPASCSVDDYFKVAIASAFIVDGNYRRVALRFPDQLLRDAREVLRAVRARVRKLVSERRKRGKGPKGRIKNVIYIDSDILDETSLMGQDSEQRVEPVAVVDYGSACVSSAKPSVPVFYAFGRGDLDVKSNAIKSNADESNPDESNGDSSNADPLKDQTSSPPSAPLVDFSTVSTFASFGDLLETVSMMDKDEGVRVWLPQKILALPESLGSSLDTDRLVRVCLDCVGSAEADNPKSMTALAIAAAVEGGSQRSILLRTQRALLQATVEMLWWAADNGGITTASGLLILPTARPSAGGAGDGGSVPVERPAPLERRQPVFPRPRREAPDARRSARNGGAAPVERPAPVKRRRPVTPRPRREAPDSGRPALVERRQPVSPRSRREGADARRSARNGSAAIEERPALVERRHRVSPRLRPGWEGPESGRDRDSATKRSRVDSNEHGDKRMKSSSGRSGPVGSGTTGGRGKVWPHNEHVDRRVTRSSAWPRPLGEGTKGGRGKAGPSAGPRGSGAKGVRGRGVAGRGATAPPPRTLLTTVTIPKQFSNQFDSLLGLCDVLKNGNLMAPQEAADLAGQARAKVENLQQVSRQDRTLFEENRIMRKLLEGIDSIAMVKGPASVALYIHDKVSSIADPAREAFVGVVRSDRRDSHDYTAIARTDIEEYWDWGPAFDRRLETGLAHGGGFDARGAYSAKKGDDFGGSERYEGTRGPSGPSAQYTDGHYGSPGAPRGGSGPSAQYADGHYGSPGGTRGGSGPSAQYTDGHYGSPGGTRGSGGESYGLSRGAHGNVSEANNYPREARGRDGEVYGSPRGTRGSGREANGSPGRAYGGGGAARDHRGGSHSHGAGAPRAPICGMCSRKGEPADHSFRDCPGITCFDCGQSGHVAEECPHSARAAQY